MFPLKLSQNDPILYDKSMLILLLSSLIGCRPWYGHDTIASSEKPIETELYISYRRFFGFSGSKVIFLPYFGCTGKVTLVVDDIWKVIGTIEGTISLPLIQRCPRSWAGELEISPSGEYIGFQPFRALKRDRNLDNSEWIIHQITEHGLFEVSQPQGTDSTHINWESLPNVLENPSITFQNLVSESAVNVIKIVNERTSEQRRQFLEDTI